MTLATKTEAELLADAVDVRRMLWRNIKFEDQRLDQLEKYCIRICNGDVQRGKALATTAIWAPI